MGLSTRFLTGLLRVIREPGLPTTRTRIWGTGQGSPANFKRAGSPSLVRGVSSQASTRPVPAGLRRQICRAPVPVSIVAVSAVRMTTTRAKGRPRSPADGGGDGAERAARGTTSRHRRGTAGGAVVRPDLLARWCAI